MTTPTILTGPELKRMRKAAKMTHYGLAKAAGVGQTTIARFEKGLITLTLTTAAKLMEAIKTKQDV